MRRLLFAPLVLAALAPAALAQPAAERRARDPESFRRAVAAARPGDRILLAPGDYKGNFFFAGVHGAEGKPIVIAAQDPDRPPRFVGDNICLQISGASHLELSDLVFAGSRDNALNIDDGNRPEKPAHHITLRRLRVTDVGPKGNVDGIKLSGVDDLLVIDCKVERWGSGGSAIDMVGCHRVRVTGCEFRQGGDDGVQAKGGSADVLISRCLFEECGERAINAGGLTGDPSFRPPLSTFPADARYEAKDVRVEGCTFVGGNAGVAVVGADGATVRYNTFYRQEKYVLRILQENTNNGFVPCRNGVFENNLIVFRSQTWGGVNVGPNTAPQTFRFAGNLWYCEDQPQRSASQLPVEEKDGIVGKDPLLGDPARKDFGVRPGSPAGRVGAHALPKDAKK